MKLVRTQCMVLHNCSIPIILLYHNRRASNDIYLFVCNIWAWSLDPSVDFVLPVFGQSEATRYM